MNKWGTSFSDPVLESNYELKQQITIRYPLFVILSFSAALSVLISTIVKIQQQSIDRAIVYAALFIFTLLQLLVIYNYRRYVNYGLFVISVVYVTICFTIVLPTRISSAMLQSYILTTAHGMIFSVQSIPFGLIQLIINTGIIFTYSLLYTELASTQVIIGYFWINIVIICCTYKVQQLNRQFYLLGQKDQKFHMLLNKVATKRVLILYFDHEQFKFRELYSNKLELKALLSCYKGNQTMSEYLYSKLKESTSSLDDVHTEDFTIKYEENLIKVNLSEFYYQSKTFMIILDEKQQIEALQIATNRIRQYLTYNINFLKEQLMTNQNHKILQCQIIFSQIIAVKQSFYQEFPIFLEVNLNKLIKHYWTLISLAYRQNKFAFEQDEIHSITSIEPLLSLVIIEVLFQFRNYKHSTCQIMRNNNFIDIKVTTNQRFESQVSQYNKKILDSILYEYKPITNGYLLVIQIGKDK